MVAAVLLGGAALRRALADPFGVDPFQVLHPCPGAVADERPPASPVTSPRLQVAAVPSVVA